MMCSCKSKVALLVNNRQGSSFVCGHVYLTFMQDAIYASTLGPARFNLLFAFESDSYILAIKIYKQKSKAKNNLASCCKSDRQQPKRADKKMLCTDVWVDLPSDIHPWQA